MKPSEFIQWLKGFLEATQHFDFDNQEYESLLNGIREKLDSVSNTATPQVFPTPEINLYPNSIGTGDNPYTINCSTSLEGITIRAINNTNQIK